MVSDLPRMGEWSPENCGGTWGKGASGPTVGATFVGDNKNGKKEWKTKSTVTACTSPSVFEFHVSAVGVKIADWRYDITPDGDGCIVKETWTDRRGWFAKKLGGPASGVADREAHNRVSMEHTLDELAKAAESSS